MLYKDVYSIDIGHAWHAGTVLRRFVCSLCLCRVRLSAYVGPLDFVTISVA